MATATASLDELNAPSPALRRFAWGILVYFVAVIVWGTMVRATGSGAGCGDHWPLCNGSFVQHSPRTDTIIEFIHRITSGISLLSLIGLLIWTWRGTKPGHLARFASVAALVLVVIEAILGALLVKLDLTGTSHSPIRPMFLAVHLANTMLLLAAITLAAHFLSRDKADSTSTARIHAPLAAVCAIAAILGVAITGSTAALADTLYPQTSLSASLAQDFAATADALVRWRWLHPVFALLSSIVMMWLLFRAAGENQFWNNRRLAGFVLAALALVYSLGLLNVALLAPVWTQAAHLAVADALWALVVVLTARLTIVPRG